MAVPGEMPLANRQHRSRLLSREDPPLCPVDFGDPMI